ncbi:DUF4126 domain-containing protein [Gammaproteobacteria bacterium]|nr:DUF4126 domain-containing protein [Gammaproteobacteria bacterium]
METISIIAAALGAAWASGINLYATILMLGLMGTTGSIDLPAELEILENPGVLAAAGLMYCVEFFTDKIPGVDTVWDAIHSFIRIPAGALLAGAAFAQITPEAELIGLILGGSLSAATHFTKAGTRVLINTSPEPVSNWTASIGEDIVVVAGLWTALNYPVLFIVLLVVFVALLIWLMPKLWRGIRTVFGKIRNWFTKSGSAAPPTTSKTDRSTKAVDQKFLK